MLATEVIEVSITNPYWLDLDDPCYPEIVDLLVPQNITNEDIRDLDAILEILGSDQNE